MLIGLSLGLNRPVTGGGGGGGDVTPPDGFEFLTVDGENVTVSGDPVIVPVEA